MAILELHGSENLLAGARASLEGNVSAVVVRSAVGEDVLDELNTLIGITGNGIASNVQELATLAIKNALPLIQTEELINQWAKTREVESNGFGHAYVRAGRAFPHVDYACMRPFVVSIGVRGSALFRTQLLGDRKVSPNGHIQFDDTVRIDRFRQKPGDAVYIPGSPARSVHAVEASVKRLACIVEPKF